MAHGSRSRYPALPAPRVSAWLSDMDDWDADDAEVFVATLGRSAPSPSADRTLDATLAVQQSA